jgi:predicted ArsR family transcriptional regulator
MFEPLRRVLAGAAGLLSWIGQRVGLLRAQRAGSDGEKALRILARGVSAPVPEVASGLGLSPERATEILTGLEERGLVQLSADQGPGHIRIAAITKKGREFLGDGA